jgi:hypothetical protein
MNTQGRLRPALKVARTRMPIFRRAPTPASLLSACSRGQHIFLASSRSSLIFTVSPHTKRLRCRRSCRRRPRCWLARWQNTSRDSRSYQIRHLPQPNAFAPSRAAHTYTQLSAVLFGALLLLSIYPSSFFLTLTGSKNPHSFFSRLLRPLAAFRSHFLRVALGPTA